MSAVMVFCSGILTFCSFLSLLRQRKATFIHYVDVFLMVFMSRYAGCRIAPRDKRSSTLNFSEYNLAPSGDVIDLAEELFAGACVETRVLWKSEELRLFGGRFLFWHIY